MANRGRSTSRPSRLATRSFGSGFFSWLRQKKTCVRRSFFGAQAASPSPQAARRDNDKRAGRSRSAETIGFCFIVLYSDLLNGS